MIKHLPDGSPFEKAIGYSRAVLDQDMIYVSGSTGYDVGTGILPEDVAMQTRNTLSIIANSLKEAGSSLKDVVRVRYYLKDVNDLEAIIPVLAEAFGNIKPAATLVVTDLILPEMKIEIEVTARIGAATS